MRARHKLTRFVRAIPAVLTAIVFVVVYDRISANIASLLSYLYPQLPLLALRIGSYIWGAVVPAIDLLNEREGWYEIPISKRIASFLMDVPPNAHLAFVAILSAGYGTYKFDLIPVLTKPARWWLNKAGEPTK